MDMRYFKDRYVNPYTDFGFKKLFGTEINKDLLISFINSLLHGKEVVKDLTYLNTEHLGTGESDLKAVFDVYCENENGEKIGIEKGEKRKAIEMVQRLKDKGVAINIIVECSGLTEEQINAL